MKALVLTVWGFPSKPPFPESSCDWRRHGGQRPTVPPADRPLAGKTAGPAQMTCHRSMGGRPRVLAPMQGRVRRG